MSKTQVLNQVSSHKKKYSRDILRNKFLNKTLDIHTINGNKAYYTM